MFHISRNVIAFLACAALAPVAGGAAPDAQPKKDGTENLTESASNLRQIAIAMHNYHNDYLKLPPPAIKSKDGKELLSWRVLLLPYLEEDRLWVQFKHDEPWDSEHNKKLLEKMPKIYAAPGVATKEPHTTFYQVFVGERAMFSKDKEFSLGQITAEDGTSNTWMIVEAGEAVPWTKPADLEYDAAKPLPKLGGTYKDSFNACFGDASVRRVKKQLDDGKLYERLVRQMITRDGGENENVTPILFK